MLSLVSVLCSRHVTLFEELLLLKDFEKQENLLEAKLEGKQQEKLDMQAKVRASITTTGGKLKGYPIRRMDRGFGGGGGGVGLNHFQPPRIAIYF